MKSFEELIGRYIMFLLNNLLSDQNPFDADGIPGKAEQKYVRELKIIDLFVDILIYPFEGTRAPFNLNKLNQKSPIVRIC